MWLVFMCQGVLLRAPWPHSWPGVRGCDSQGLRLWENLSNLTSAVATARKCHVASVWGCAPSIHLDWPYPREQFPFCFSKGQALFVLVFQHGLWLQAMFHGNGRKADGHANKVPHVDALIKGRRAHHTATLCQDSRLPSPNPRLHGLPYITQGAAEVRSTGQALSMSTSARPGQLVITSYGQGKDWLAWGWQSCSDWKLPTGRQTQTLACRGSFWS